MEDALYVWVGKDPTTEEEGVIAMRDRRDPSRSTLPMVSKTLGLALVLGALIDTNRHKEIRLVKYKPAETIVELP